MRLRTKAIELGLQVKLAPVPGSEAIKKERSSTTMMSYRFMRPSTEAKVLSHHYQTGRSITNSNEWVFYQTQTNAPVMLGEAVLPLLTRFPDTVIALESMQGFVAAYWSEVGGEESLDAIFETLKAIHETEMNYFSQL